MNTIKSLTWPALYIGLPWEAGGQGPHAFDCMGLFKHLQASYFGVQVPSIIAPDYDDPQALAPLFKKHAEHARWHRILAPEHGCAVIIHRPMHIGVWLDFDGGGVLHCMRGAGVVYTSQSAWILSGFGRCEYFRHVSKKPQ